MTSPIVNLDADCETKTAKSLDGFLRPELRRQRAVCLHRKCRECLQAYTFQVISQPETANAQKNHARRRTPTPSGAAAVEWFDRWCRERDPAVKQRMLEYNEDDCRATRVLLDGIRDLTI